MGVGRRFRGLGFAGLGFGLTVETSCLVHDDLGLTAFGRCKVSEFTWRIMGRSKDSYEPLNWGTTVALVITVVFETYDPVSTPKTPSIEPIQIP